MFRFAAFSLFLAQVLLPLCLADGFYDNETCTVASSKLFDGYNTQCNETSCVPCEINPNPDPNRRRRYEIRDLPEGHFDSFVFAVKEMKNLTMEEGTVSFLFVLSMACFFC